MSFLQPRRSRFTTVLWDPGALSIPSFSLHTCTQWCVYNSIATDAKRCWPPYGRGNWTGSHSGPLLGTASALRSTSGCKIGKFDWILKVQHTTNSKPAAHRFQLLPYGKRDVPSILTGHCGLINWQLFAILSDSGTATAPLFDSSQ